MATKFAFEGQDDYTWDDFGDSERSWDDWFNEKWDPGGVIQVKFSTPSIGGTFSSTVLPVATFSQSTQGTFSSPADITSTFSTSIFGTWSSTANPNPTFTIVGNAIYGNAALVSAIPGAFTPVVNANFVGTDSITVLKAGTFSITSNANTVFNAPALLPSEFAQVTNANYANAALVSAIDAFNTQLTTARYVSIADPWNLAKALQENRLYKLTAETRLIELNQETRVNSVKQETRVKSVMQETRVYKIPKPEFVDDTQIPRVRGN